MEIEIDLEMEMELEVVFDLDEMMIDHLDLEEMMIEIDLDREARLLHGR